jgi:hypothetical protein
VKIWKSPGESRVVILASQLTMLFKNVDTWLMMGTMFGSFFVWGIGDYIAIFAHTIYGASISEAATISSAYPSGQLCGLIVDAIILSTAAPGKGRRILYLMGWLSTLLIFGLVSFLYLVPVGPSNFAGLVFCLGSLGVQISYVPVGVFAVNEANSGRAGSALCNGVLDGIVGIVTGSFSVYIAYIRANWSEYSALRAVLISILVGLSVTIPCFSTYIWRNWNGPLLNPAEHSDEPDDIEDNSSGSSGSTDVYRQRTSTTMH